MTQTAIYVPNARCECGEFDTSATDHAFRTPDGFLNVHSILKCYACKINDDILPRPSPEEGLTNGASIRKLHV